jgi:Xaa-Pro aminopeptidase
MSAFERRAERLAELAAERELDVLLVSNLINVRYVCGFSGTNGVCLLGPEARTLFTDFRYVERARAEAPDYELVQGKQDLLGDVARLLSDRSARSKTRVGFDDLQLSVSAHARLREALPEAVELVPAARLVEQLRAVKDAEELARIRKAARLADGVYRWLVEEHGLIGRTERAVARALGRRVEDLGADGVAFPPIVAAGANGALPHATPRDVEIGRGELVIVDFGCMLDGYCSDCTRTYATGELDDEAAAAYELVRSAQAAALDAVAPGADVRAVDAIARGRIDEAGRGQQFGHGTGHGVGLEVHEAPRIAATGEGELAVGNVVTVEPGVYEPGRFGIRIEDLVVVRENGGELLTACPKELVAVAG